MEATANLLLIALEILAPGLLIAGCAWWLIAPRTPRLASPSTQRGRATFSGAGTPKPPRKFRSF